jgi:hypothetical protein
LADKQVNEDRNFRTIIGAGYWSVLPQKKYESSRILIVIKIRADQPQNLSLKTKPHDFTNRNHGVSYKKSDKSVFSDVQ